MSLVRAQAGIVQTVGSFDHLIQSFAPDVVAYWKLADGEQPPPIPAHDQQGLVNGTYAGSPTFGVPTIVQRDTGGHCVRLNGTEHVDIPHHAALKTDEGTILVFHQHDTLSQKSTLLAADSNATTGGVGLEVMPNGGMRSFLAVSAADYRTLEGPAGDVVLRNAYCSTLRWGAGGMAHDLFGESGHIRTLTDPATSGFSGTSTIRLGAWHSGVSRHVGPLGRVIWLKKRLSDADLASLTLPLTLWEAQAANDSFTVAPGSGITPLAVQANDTLLAGDEQTEIMPGSFSGDGSIAFNADGKRVDYTAPAAEGSATFQYRLRRGWPVSDTVAVTITVAEQAGFTGPTTLQSAKAGDNLQSVGGINIQSASPI